MEVLETCSAVLQETTANSPLLRNAWPSSRAIGPEVQRCGRMLHATADWQKSCMRVGIRHESVAGVSRCDAASLAHKVCCSMWGRGFSKRWRVSRDAATSEQNSGDRQVGSGYPVAAAAASAAKRQRSILFMPLVPVCSRTIDEAQFAAKIHIVFRQTMAGNTETTSSYD